MALAPHTPVRTNGDGMENPDSDSSMEVKDPNKLVPFISNALDHIKLSSREISATSQLKMRDQLIYRPQEYCPSPAPVVLGEMIPIMPSHPTSSSSSSTGLKSFRGKEPKFVPYEPYKAAVNPLVTPIKKDKPNRKNLQVNKGHDLNIGLATATLPDLEITTEQVDDKEKQVLQEELTNIRDENEQLQTQLKFQAQVNAELKKLLVAAVGEDLEVRVQHLTEDKLHLARALLSSSNNLSSHQEQLEWLAGQCEVWRSKFLASSLMVEELARWKAALCHRNTELQEAIKHILQERSSVRDNMLSTLRTLQILRENFDPASGLSLVSSPHRKMSASSCLTSSSVLDVSAANLRLSKSLSQRLLGGVGITNRKDLMAEMEGLEHRTSAEKKAEQLLSAPSIKLLNMPDIACSAVVGAAAAVGGQLFAHIGNTPTSCCAHCRGEMKIL